MSRPPGAPDDPEEVFGFFRRSDETDYWEGERPPEASDDEHGSG
jgi:hypothetical protein